MAYGWRTATCQQCGTEFSGHFPPSRMFCGTDCRQAYRNHPDRNPAKSDAARAKLSASSAGRQACLGRVLSDETKAKIAQSLRGRKQPPEQTEKMRTTLRATLEQHGGLTPAMREYHSKPRPKGPEHPRWRGQTPQRTREWQTTEYKAFRRAVAERDKHTCQDCGYRHGLGETRRLEVHHVLSYADHPELRFDPTNGELLCRPCHLARQTGVPRNTRVDSQPKPRTCGHCGERFSIRNPRKYCPSCRAAICCPVCGSTTCNHSARKALPYYSQANQLG